MFRPVFRQSSLLARTTPVRFASTSAYVAKASGFVSSVTSKTMGLVNCSLYWTKVTGELLKHIYVKEGLSPPSIAQFQEVYKNLWKQTLDLSLKYAKQPQLFQSTVQSIGKQELIKGGAVLVQFAGLYSLGEIIGRRNVFGYPKHGEAAHHH